MGFEFGADVLEITVGSQGLVLAIDDFETGEEVRWELIGLIGIGWDGNA